MFRPHLDMIIGFLINTQMKADAKLTVVMWYQIFYSKSIAQASGDFCRRPPPRLACGPNQEFSNFFL